MQASVVFHTEGNFGIVTLKAPKVPLTDRTQVLLFKGDISGSMSDLCSDGRTKIAHANHSMANMAKTLLTASSCQIQVDGFDDMITSFVPLTQLSPTSLPDTLEKIKWMAPRNSTNIELALRHTLDQIASIRETFPEADITQIFTTDGNPTVGCGDKARLKAYVDSSIKNVFIGFGLDHSAELLGTLGGVKNAEYYFIDEIERGGLVYGEIVHSVLYTALKNVRLWGQDVEYFNFRTGAWDRELILDVLTSEATKIIHVRKTGPVPSVSIGEQHIPDAEKKNLQPYLFRQRTLELLHQVIYEARDGPDLRPVLTALLNEIKAYKTAHTAVDPVAPVEGLAPVEELLLKSLCDDISISLRTYRTEKGHMFSVGRLNSNGFERACNVTAPRRQCHFAIPRTISRYARDEGDEGAVTDEEVEGEEGAEGVEGVEATSAFLNSNQMTECMSQIMRTCSLPHGS